MLVGGYINSLAPGKFEWNFRHIIFKQILVIDDWGISSEIALTWKPQDLTDDKSTLVQIMAWCRQATSHYLSQCRPRSMSPNGVTRPQWVNTLSPRQDFWRLVHSWDMAITGLILGLHPANERRPYFVTNSNSNSKTFIASYTYNAYRELACNKGDTAQTRQN